MRSQESYAFGCSYTISGINQYHSYQYSRYISKNDFQCEPNAFYIFVRAYFNLASLEKNSTIGFYFIICQKGRLQYNIVDGENLIDGVDGIIFDQIFKRSGYQSIKYLGSLHSISTTPRSPNARSNYYQCVLSMLKILQYFTKSVSRWTCFSNISSSICTSNPLGAILKTQSEYKFIETYPLTI